LTCRSYFTTFRGNTECNIHISDIYQPIPLDHSTSNPSPAKYCPNRKSLLKALSSGGRIGFDAPYFPRDCHYRWYTVPEICMILERFDNIIFIGDESLRSVYAGLNILLRQDLAHGALRTWDMDEETLRGCACERQFTSSSCAGHFVTASSEVTSAPRERVNSPYTCSRTPHTYLPITSEPDQSILDKFSSLIPHIEPGNYHPIPIIISLNPATFSLSAATSTLESLVRISATSRRQTPILYLGPTASGHIEIRNRKNNQEIWEFDAQMRQLAEDNSVEVLGMWNLTVQAGSWDGVRFAERVGVVQGMMVVNWLARLESS
jgi:hypothetical protein